MDNDAKPPVEPVETSNTQPATPDAQIAENVSETLSEPSGPLVEHVFSTTGQWDEEAVTLTLPSQYEALTRRVIEAMPNISVDDNPDSRSWGKAVVDGLDYTTYADAFESTVKDPTAAFRQSVEYHGNHYGGQAPRFKATEHANLKGERAVLRTMAALGLGTMFQVPLWHSGIWLTLKPPSESEIIEINRLLTSDKIKLGRHTYGLIFSNTTVYTIDRFVDFALSHVYDSSVKTDELPLDRLKAHISCQDIPSLLWGFACTMHPRGFQYRRACIETPDKCNHVLEENLNLTKLQWTNTAALSDWHKTVMSKRQSKVTDLATIKRYQSELAKTQPFKITLTNEISITLKTPSITDYVTAGHTWISEIVNFVERALDNEATEGERNNLVIKHGQATAMRNYSHWVDNIEVDSNLIDDRETLEATLGVLSADDAIRNRFIDEVVKYINQSTLSVIGIPVFDCPKCMATQSGNTSLPQYKNIIPLDVVQLFFGLLTQRLWKIVER